jgi:hypothetical protein
MAVTVHVPLEQMLANDLRDRPADIRKTYGKAAGGD